MGVFRNSMVAFSRSLLKILQAIFQSLSSSNRQLNNTDRRRLHSSRYQTEKFDLRRRAGPTLLTLANKEMSLPTLDVPEQPTSAQIVVSIDDLLTEILLRLPIKSLIRFTEVSTHWYELITNPKFCYLRSPNPKSNPALGLFLPRDDHVLCPVYDYIPFAVQNPSNPPRRWFDIRDPRYDVCIQQSCNGLLLCRSHLPHDFIHGKYHVYNPTLNRFVNIPKPGQEPGIKKRIDRMNLAFDPAKSPHFKVVCLEEVELSETELAGYLEVYSSETGRWKVSLTRSFAHQLHSLNGVYWNGALHWINQWTFHVGVYFVLDEERLETMPMLPIPLELEGQIQFDLYESCDHLHMIVRRPSIKFDVYEMKRDYSEWFVKYEVDLSPLDYAFPGIIHGNPRKWGACDALWIYCVIRGEIDDDDFLVLEIPGKTIRYNLVSQTFQELRRWFGADESEESLKSKFPHSFTFQYIESLCWPLRLDLAMRFFS